MTIVGNTLFNGPGSHNKIHKTSQPKKQRGRTRYSTKIIGTPVFNGRGSQATKNNKAQPTRLSRKKDTQRKSCSTQSKKQWGRTRRSVPILGITLFNGRNNQARKNNKAQPDRRREQFLRGWLLIELFQPYSLCSSPSYSSSTDIPLKRV